MGEILYEHEWTEGLQCLFFSMGKVLMLICKEFKKKATQDIMTYNLKHKKQKVKTSTGINRFRIRL